MLKPKILRVKSLSVLWSLPKAYRTTDGWIYRGQTNANWPLRTFFERSLLDVTERKIRNVRKSVLRDILGKGLTFKSYLHRTECRSVFELEEGLIRTFQRALHFVSPEIHRPDGMLETLALMQHYGAPTTLMDWNYSFFIALYFAVETYSGKDCVIWILNSDLVRRITEKYEPRFNKSNMSRDKNLQDDSNFRFLYRNKNNPHEFVMPVNPFHLNKRLFVQQGLFLCQGNLCTPFEDNLAEVTNKINEGEDILIKIVISKNLRIRILRELFRMNIHSASVYPDIYGYAKSMGSYLAFPRILAAPLSQF